MPSIQGSQSSNYLELLPATTYTPPSPRGRFVAHPYGNAMPTQEEIIAATRGRRSSSISTVSSVTSSTDGDKRRYLELVPEHSDTE
ncbi:hypothetical protein MMC06_003506 [Schaereria dolodes]|nr:hypothetical protein [Schaereria dolodes]